MAYRSRIITAKRKLCLDDDIVKKGESTQKPRKKNDYEIAGCSTDMNIRTAANTSKKKPEGYKLRESSNVKYFEEVNDSEDFSPDCSEYIPSPERLLPDSRSTSSLGIDLQDVDSSFIKSTNTGYTATRLQDIESRASSSLGGDSHVIENLLNHGENIPGTPSTVSNLSLILDETELRRTDFLASPTTIYNLKYKSQNENNTSEILDVITLKKPNGESPLLITDKSTPEIQDKTLTPNDSIHDIITTSPVNQILQKSPEREDNKEERTYKIEIVIEPESPTLVNELDVEAKQRGFDEGNYRSPRNNIKNTEKDPLDLNDSTDKINILDLNNQSQEVTSAGQEQEPVRFTRPQTPVQEISVNITTISTVNESNNNNIQLVPESGSENENEDQMNKLTRKRKCDPSEWKDNKNKKLKNSGKAYKGVRNKSHYPSKQILPCCNCKKECGLKFNIVHRQALHKRFYELANREYQWQYIVRHVKTEDVKKITVNRKTNRTQTIKYHFPLDKEEVQVCKVFFLNTLAITEQMVYTALEKLKTDESLIDKRGLHLNRPHRMKPSTEESIKAHINTFPRIKAHYTRKDSQRKYLNEDLNISKMYRFYKVWFAEQNYSNNDVQMASKRQYERVFNTQFNLSFFKPKKDQCTLCSQYIQADPIEKAAMEDKYNKHLNMKEKVRQIKNEEKATLNKEDTAVAIYDLQKVLSVPRSEVSIFHYKRKYPVYNFTVYEALHKHGFCYVWHAQIGNKGCKEIGSCLLQFIQTMHKRGVRKIIFYSDGCYGQNKNRYMFALYLYAAITLQLEITHRFFVGGHSQNEGDSMHACIEKALKNKVVYTPDQIYNIIANAKVSGEKYILKEMQQSEILNIKELVEPKRWLKDKSGEKVRWSDVMEVSVSHTKPNCFLFKYDYDEEYSELDLELLGTTRSQNNRRRGDKNQHQASQTIDSVQLKPVNDNLLPITKALYDDLKSLCNSQAIPLHYHEFYNNLRHATTAEDDYNE